MIEFFSLFKCHQCRCKDTIYKKAQIISFVERGFERLGLGHRMMVSRGVHTENKLCSLEKSISSIRSGRLWFLAFFLSHFFWTAYFSYYTNLYPSRQRPRVGSTFQNWYLSHQPIPKVVGGGCKSWRAWSCQVQSIQWQ